MEMVCIVCPNGCHLEVERDGEKVTVTGARCKRGEDFARTELICPMRTVTSSVKTQVKGFPVVSVKTDGEIPKDKVFELMKLLATVVVKKPLPLGSVVLENIFGTNVNVITTMEIENE